MKLGQHFMVDGKALKKVIESAELEKTDRVLEVGPGEGALTGLLADRCSVTAVEMDRELSGKLAEKFPQVETINADVLKADWPPFNKCVSNLPYFVSKKFILKLLQHEFELSVLVLQKEFAQKLAAAPGEKNYGTVSVCTQLCCDVELLDTIPKNAFRPQPKVESRIVRLTQREKLEKGFLDFITLQFQHRNKKMGDKRVREFSPTEFLSIYQSNK